MLVQPRCVSSCIIRASHGRVACPSGVFSRLSASVCLIATAYLFCQYHPSILMAHQTHVDDFPLESDLVHSPTTPKDPLPSSSLHCFREQHGQKMRELILPPIRHPDPHLSSFLVWRAQIACCNHHTTISGSIFWFWSPFSLNLVSSGLFPRRCLLL